MVVFRCRNCQAVLSRAVREVELPEYDDAPLPFRMPEGHDCPPRMAPGAFAVEYLSVPGLDQYPGLQGAMPVVQFVLCPQDVLRLEPIRLGSRRAGCCGPMGLDGANLACAGCRTEAAVETADCATPQQIALLVPAVERTTGGG
ncbi:hypothetical protein ACIP9H_15810 [Streptomyces sp. NPDC088732]|uniref:hypothetical protein n=1 Tax=Streptomyces sp. NPDC088732 TaxID=3365879 RepID=UPI00380D6EE4